MEPKLDNLRAETIVSNLNKIVNYYDHVATVLKNLPNYYKHYKDISDQFKKQSEEWERRLNV